MCTEVELKNCDHWSTVQISALVLKFEKIEILLRLDDRFFVQGLIRPASPATNVQPQAVSGSHSVALHHHTSNAVIGQASYFQQPMLTHGNFVSNK